MNFDERLAKAAARPRPHKDVIVLLDQDAADERDRLVEQLTRAQEADEADARLAAPTTTGPIEDALAALQDNVRDALVTLRFVRLPGWQWAELTTRFPPNPKVETHRFYGYDIDAVVRAAALYADPATQEVFAFRLEGGAPVPLQPAQWLVMFDTLTGSEMSDIRDAVWSLNEYEPEQRIEALVKGFGAAPRSDEK